MSVVAKAKTILRKYRFQLIKKAWFKKVLNNLGTGILETDEFKNNDIKKCFEDKRLPTQNEIIIERIIKAYNEAKDVQKTLPEAFQVGNEWLPIYEKYMGGIMKALSTANKADVIKIYENFMREDCSIGLHGLPFDMNEEYFKGNIPAINRSIYLHDSVYRLYHWKELTGNKHSIKELQMSGFGNPYGLYADNEFIRTGAEYLHYYANRILELVKDEKGKRVIVELGGGYGGLGYFLNKLIPDVVYVDFDLPENMALTAYYLMNSFPEKKVMLYGEGDFNENSLKEFDIIIMPNFEITKLPTDKVKLAFNSYSLAEMSTETIKTYIPELKRASKEYIFHVNHTKMSASLKADEFGIEEGYNLVSKKPALWNLGRNANMDEYEYLYTKENA